MLLTLLAAVWLIKRSIARRRAPDVARRSAAKALPETLPACRHCGTHVPASEAVHGRLGVYCSQAHAQAAGDLRA